MKSLIILGACILIISGCFNLSPDPEFNLRNIAGVHYYECPKCGSLDGGYYGKGGVSSWHSETGRKCWHSWSEVTAEEFDEKWRERNGTTSHY